VHPTVLPLLAHRVILHTLNRQVALGAKRTSKGRQAALDGSVAIDPERTLNGFQYMAFSNDLARRAVRQRQ
jgi:hypothetical protein